MPRKYPEATRRTAIDLARTVGVDTASERLQLPRGTVASWKFHADKVGRVALGVEDEYGNALSRIVTVSDGPSETWDVERQLAVDELAHALDVATRLLTQLLLAGQVADADKCASVIARIIDKGELLTGRTIDRSASVSLSVSASLEALQTWANRAAFPQPRVTDIDVTSTNVLPSPGDDVSWARGEADE